MIKTDSFEKVEVDCAAALLAWLKDNHSQPESVWLVTFKRVIPSKYVSRSEVLDALIAFGWIDGIRRKLDDERTMQLISPRREEVWAKTYKDRAVRLKAESKMQPAGLATIERAKAAGKWSVSDPIDALLVPKDLQDALSKTQTALAFFEGSAPSYRRNILRFLASAKRPETRAKRIQQIYDYSAKQAKVPQY